MTIWELLSNSAALIRRHWFRLLLLIAPAFASNYLINQIFGGYKPTLSQFRLHPLQISLLVNGLRFGQFFLGWLFIAIEFGAICIFTAERKSSANVLDAITRVRQNSFELVKLSWAIYWRVAVVLVPVMLLVLYVAAGPLRLYEVTGPWFATITVLFTCALTALLTSKLLLAIPEVVVGGESSAAALKACSRMQDLHERVLVLTLFFVAVLTFSVFLWPKMLMYVSLPESWPAWAVKFVQAFSVPITSLAFEAWGSLMLIIGVQVLWESRATEQIPEVLLADPFHR